jgi:threonine/homoserine/homoserine lactone efflux protein
MRVTKLVIGILMIVLSVWLFLDGLLGQLLGIYATKSIVGGILEIIIAGLFIGAGIVYICLEKVLT